MVEGVKAKIIGNITCSSKLRGNDKLLTLARLLVSEISYVVLYNKH